MKKKRKSVKIVVVAPVLPPVGSLDVWIGCYEGSHIEPVNSLPLVSGGGGSVELSPYYANLKGVSKSGLAYLVGVDGMVKYFNTEAIIKAIGVVNVMQALETLHDKFIMQKIEEALDNRLSRLTEREEE